MSFFDKTIGDYCPDNGVLGLEACKTCYWRGNDENPDSYACRIYMALIGKRTLYDRVLP